MEHDETYVAAVVDYHPRPWDDNFTVAEYMLANAAEHVSFIKEAKKLDAEIIVFPECGLTGITGMLGEAGTVRPKFKSIDVAIEIPSPVEPFESKGHTFTPDQEVLKVLSDAAKESSIYVVANLVEKVNCSTETDCPPEQLIFYNSNIVFNRHGCIISRYRKYNLYGEAVSAEKEANLSTFETDFNVTFGMMICFDILFGNPAQRLITEKGVSDIIFSSAWFSELPFLTATSVEAGWAHSMNVNLLASGIRNPATGNGGSGIYNGSGGPLAVTVPLTEDSVLLTAQVPIKPTKHAQTKCSYFSYSSAHSNIGKTEQVGRIDSPRQRQYIKSEYFGDLLLKKDPSLSSMSSELLEPDSLDPSSIIYSYHKNDLPGFISSISVKWRVDLPLGNSTPRYRMVSFNGLRPFGDVRNESVGVCGVVACGDETFDSCGEVLPLDSAPKIIFESIELRVKSDSLTLGYLPITMDFGLKPLPPSVFKFSKEYVHSNQTEPVCIVKMALIKPVQDLFSFAIYKIPD
nr:PREDICTED: vanin-like protein 2 isoform X2 [Bemisia tabaci]XP_018907026.1 PREDICTED: vanin-like protein 2 isoform X2 [Bemisia tabaci]